MTDTSGRVSSPCADACKAVITDEFAKVNQRIGGECEVTITTAPPLFSSPWTQTFTCPHGVKFYMEPTGDQRAAWARDGVL